MNSPNAGPWNLSYVLPQKGPTHMTGSDGQAPPFDRFNLLLTVAAFRDVHGAQKHLVVSDVTITITTDSVLNWTWTTSWN